MLQLKDITSTIIGHVVTVEDVGRDSSYNSAFNRDYFKDKAFFIPLENLPDNGNKKIRIYNEDLTSYWTFEKVKLNVIESNVQYYDYHKAVGKNLYVFN